jgi:hypothetical protein
LKTILEQIKNGRSVDFDHNIAVTISSPEDRVLLAIEVSVEYSDEDIKTKTVAIDDKEAVTIPNEWLKEKGVKAVNIEVSAIVTEEKVAWSLSDQYVVESAQGCITGEDYEFSVYAKDGYEIKSVGYKIGNATKVTALELTDGGNYTIKGSEITAKVTIVVEAVAVERTTKVLLSADDKTDTSKFNFYDRDTKEQITSTALGSAKAYATVGKPYFFKVEPISPLNSVKEVTYSISGAGKYVAEATAAKNVYKIPADREEGYITIAAEAFEMVPVYGPDLNGNEKAVVWYNGEAQEDVFYIKKDEDFTFALKGSDDKETGIVLFDKVKYVISGGATVEEDLDNEFEYTKTIPAKEIAGGINLLASTTEVARVGTYEVTFVPDAYSRYDKDGNLLIACTDDTVLTATLDGDEISKNDFTAEYKMASKGVVEIEESPKLPYVTLTAEKV